VTVFVVGHRGMLGHVVAKYAARVGHRVLTAEEHYEARPRDVLVEAARACDATVVINCLGRTLHGAPTASELMTANALLPVHLAARLRPQQYLIHASTDCVFRATGGHRVGDERDASDAYGFSKILGEAVAHLPNVTVIRTSVVGPSPGNGRGLLEWFLARPPAVPVPGWTDHRWNGITTLDWAEVAFGLAEARQRGQPVPCVCQPGTEVISKYQLLCAFRDLLRPDAIVEPVASGEVVDRSLVPTETRASIVAQLERLSIWYGDSRYSLALPASRDRLEASA
jgi:dTDP-4-dehydrorhamnose reductase